VGTAKYIPKIPGIDICAKTGTAENYRVLNGVRTKLKDHSIFACFAPRENPKIAIAVIVENGGFGSTWAGPIAFLMIEKYLTDSLRADRLKEVERIAGTNLMPGWLPRRAIQSRFHPCPVLFQAHKRQQLPKEVFQKSIPAGKKGYNTHQSRKPNLWWYISKPAWKQQNQKTLTLKKRPPDAKRQSENRQRDRCEPDRVVPAAGGHWHHGNLCRYLPRRRPVMFLFFRLKPITASSFTFLLLHCSLAFLSCLPTVNFSRQQPTCGMP
jgi:hypothetical protein